MQHQFINTTSIICQYMFAGRGDLCYLPSNFVIVSSLWVWRLLLPLDEDSEPIKTLSFLNPGSFGWGTSKFSLPSISTTVDIVGLSSARS